jgi:hypothetical protein
METFSYTAPADVFVAGLRRARQIVYRKFPTGAEALRHAMETIPRDARPRVVVESDEVRLGPAEIEALYWSNTYPLARGPG